MRRTSTITSLLVVGAIGVSACGSSTSSSTKLSSAYCAKATALGSLSKGAQEAMSMRKAGAEEAAKDFTTMASKIKALRDDAPKDLQADIDTLTAHTNAEAMMESHLKPDGTGAEQDAAAMAASKDKDDKAIAMVIARTKAGCNVDLT